MSDIKFFFSPSEECLAAFNVWAAPYVDRIRVDHIGYKCATTEEFERLRAMMEPFCAYIYQSFISGRRIAFCKFSPSLTTAVGEIQFLELSDQKPDGSQKSGFDHLEIYPRSGTMEELAAFFAEQGSPFTPTVRPHHTTYDRKLLPTFSIRIEPEALIEKIKQEEMGTE